MLFGASYYHEYMPYDRLEADIELMKRANFTVVRVGESTWASYEPKPGEISFTALRRVVDALGAAGIKVIVGTPTYAIPAWMAHLHPEVMAVTRRGAPVPYGARQNVDFTSPAYLFYAERLLRAMSVEFGHHDGVIGFQVDNEIGATELVNPHVLARFRAEVMQRLGGVEGANERWGLTYWSHRLSSPEELWAPAGNTNPGYALEWERFQARLATEFLVWQRDLLRPLIAHDKEILHCTVSGWGSRWSDPHAIAESLDRAATNIYVAMQDALAFPEAGPGARDLVPATHPGPFGAWQALWRADAGYAQRGRRGSRFYVTEAQAGTIGPSSCNVPPYPGQLRLMAHIFASRGAGLLAYWHWHSLHYGAETYYGGVLGHDLEPGRIFEQVADLGHELRRLGPELEGMEPHADIAILCSRDSLRALEATPPFPEPGTARPDRSGYHRIFSRFYTGALEAGLQVRIAYEDSDWDGPAVLVVPALYIASDEMLERIVARAEAGQHVVVTFRTGYADEWARIPPVRAPRALRGPAGVSYQEFTTIAEPVALTPAGPGPGLGGPPLPPGAEAESWADCLQLEGATAFWQYEHPFLGSFPALCSKAVGKGRISWLGTLPDRGSCAALLAWALAERGGAPASAVWQDVPGAVRVTSATHKSGGTLWFVANHGFEPAEVRTPAPMRDLTSQSELGTSLRLGAWDSRALLQAP
jgi:beta-galactosidase